MKYIDVAPDLPLSMADRRRIVQVLPADQCGRAPRTGPVIRVSAGQADQVAADFAQPRAPLGDSR